MKHKPVFVAIPAQHAVDAYTQRSAKALNNLDPIIGEGGVRASGRVAQIDRVGQHALYFSVFVLVVRT